MRRERTNLFPCRKTQFCDTLKRPLHKVQRTFFCWEFFLKGVTLTPSLGLGFLFMVLPSHRVFAYSIT